MLRALLFVRYLIMPKRVTIDVEVNTKWIRNMFPKLWDDPVVKLEINNLLAKYCDPYVPMREGVLSQTIEVSEYGVRYRTPYAHYMYNGIVYGPNFPIWQHGMIVGWYSIPNQKKQKTDRNIKYSQEMHPLATHHWDKAMMKDKGKDFTKEVQQILNRRLWELMNG